MHGSSRVDNVDGGPTQDQGYLVFDGWYDGYIIGKDAYFYTTEVHRTVPQLKVEYVLGQMPVRRDLQLSSLWSSVAMWRLPPYTFHDT